MEFSCTFCSYVFYVQSGVSWIPQCPKCRKKDFVSALNDNFFDSYELQNMPPVPPKTDKPLFHFATYARTPELTGKEIGTRLAFVDQKNRYGTSSLLLPEIWDHIAPFCDIHSRGHDEIKNNGIYGLMLHTSRHFDLFRNSGWLENFPFFRNEFREWVSKNKIRGTEEQLQQLYREWHTNRQAIIRRVIREGATVYLNEIQLLSKGPLFKCLNSKCPNFLKNYLILEEFMEKQTGRYMHPQRNYCYDIKMLSTPLSPVSNRSIPISLKSIFIIQYSTRKYLMGLFKAYQSLPSSLITGTPSIAWVLNKNFPFFQILNISKSRVVRTLCNFCIFRRIHTPFKIH